MSKNLTSGATETPPNVPTTVPTKEQIQELVIWYQTYFTQISDCCTSNLTSGTTVPTAEKTQELVIWHQTYFTQISDCCRSKGLPKPPRW